MDRRYGDMRNKYKVRLGAAGESFSADILKSMGYVILAKNFRCYAGEIDIIARKGKEIHFIEVKTRVGSENGMPEEAVTEKKLKAMRAAANYYMLRLGSEGYEVVFDVFAIEVCYIENCA